MTAAGKTGKRAPAVGPFAYAIDGRVDALDWPRIENALAQTGAAQTGALLDPAECAELVACYGHSGKFRSRIVMARHGFGSGEYKYFAYPLPPLVADLRTALYRRLAPLANRWQEALRRDFRYPARHAAYIEQCHAAGQSRPTPLLLRYVSGDYNCLHQDLYGDLLFPLQATFLLNQPGTDFEGGEFALTEQRPRMQSRVQVVSLALGEGVIFAVNQRPVQGSRGTYRVTMRHGVSRVHSGLRHTLGIIFHDAT